MEGQKTISRFMWVSDKFGTCTVVSVNRTLVEYKMRRFKDEFAHFSLNKCPIYTDDGASDKFSTDSHETDNMQCAVLLVAEFVLWSNNLSERTPLLDT